MHKRRGAYRDCTDERSIAGKDNEEGGGPNKGIKIHRQYLDSEAMIVT